MMKQSTFATCQLLLIRLREYKRRFDFEAARLDKRRSQGEAHPKESISGRWKGDGNPPVVFWIRAIRWIIGKLSGTKNNYSYNRGDAEYEAFLRGEELEDESDLD